MLGAEGISGMADFDLAIICGGINGVGVARDAAGRGLSVLLVEQNDLASGTSSASTSSSRCGGRGQNHAISAISAAASVARTPMAGNTSGAGRIQTSAQEALAPASRTAVAARLDRLRSRNWSRGFGVGNFKALFEAIEIEQARRGNL